MQRRSSFDKLLAQPAQHVMVAKRKWVMLRFGDSVTAVTANAIDSRNGMANGTGDTGLRRRLIMVIG